jgi:hypothetical protein
LQRSKQAERDGIRLDRRPRGFRSGEVAVEHLAVVGGAPAMPRQGYAAATGPVPPGPAPRPPDARSPHTPGHRTPQKVKGLAPLAPLRGCGRRLQQAEEAAVPGGYPKPLAGSERSFNGVDAPPRKQGNYHRCRGSDPHRRPEAPGRLWRTSPGPLMRLPRTSAGRDRDGHANLVGDRGVEADLFMFSAQRDQ